jgi:hypothetical protein
MIIDACNSGQALENKDEPRRGPMNTRGLAQLAYEKGMYIMAASQNVEEAFVSKKLKHSYLTFALVEEGLKTKVADENHCSLPLCGTDSEAHSSPLCYRKGNRQRGHGSGLPRAR